MHRDDSLGELFEDLEQQASGLHLADRDAELADRGAAEYAAVDLAGRLHASQGRRVTVRVAGAGTLAGTVERIGRGCFLLTSPNGDWWVSVAAVEELGGLSAQAVSESLRGVSGRLGLRSVLRGVVEAGDPVSVQFTSGDRVAVRVLRVGADFVEAVPDDTDRPGDTVVLPLGRIATVRLR